MPKRAGEIFLEWAEKCWKIDRQWEKAERTKGENEESVSYRIFREAVLNEFDKIVDSILRGRMNSKIHSKKRHNSSGRL